MQFIYPSTIDHKLLVLTKQARREISLEALRSIEQDFFLIDQLKERFHRSGIVRTGLVELNVLPDALRPKLTKLGNIALKQLNSGCVWSVPDQCSDVQATINYYLRQLNQLGVPTWVFQRIDMLPEEYRDLQTKAVYQKLRSQLEGERWFGEN